jgi:hypothetical protein
VIHYLPCFNYIETNVKLSAEKPHQLGFAGELIERTIALELGGGRF